MFQILHGSSCHPYLTLAQQSRVDDLLLAPHGYDRGRFTAAALLEDAPGIRWPKGSQGLLPPRLMGLVEGLVCKDGRQAGIKEVRVQSGAVCIRDWAVVATLGAGIRSKSSK